MPRVKTTTEMPTTGLMIYTIVDPKDNGFKNFVDSVRDIVGDHADTEILHFTKDGRPAVLTLERHYDAKEGVYYTLTGGYRVTVSPGDRGTTTHVAQVDNEVFLDHVFLVHWHSLLKQ